MNLPVSPDAIGQILQSAGGVAAVFDAVAGHRQRRANSYATNVAEITGIVETVLAERLGKDPVLEELFEAGAWAAARTEAEQKRWHLARVVAAGVTGEASIDKMHVYLRTVGALDPVHVQLLVHVEEQADAAGDVTEVEIREVFPEVGDLLGALLAVLIGEGLVDSRGTRVWVKSEGGSVGSPVWGLTSYGGQLLALLRSGGS